MTIDLGLAATLPLESPFPYSDSPPAPGSGVYDPTRWAVVFRYTEVVIPPGKTVKFENHPSGAPVVWLVSGDVTIEGAVSLNGADGTGGAYTQSAAGPGGWRGGRAFQSELSLGSAGFGPGGGKYAPGESHNAGSYATAGSHQPEGPLYGGASAIPLIGGSGGAAGNAGDGGGAGGGAILIAAAGTVAISGSLTANGGVANGSCFFNTPAGPGSGGAIRIVGEVISASGVITATGGNSQGCSLGGYGRVRLETTSSSLSGTISPANPPGFSIAVPGEPAQIWADDDAPTVRVTHVGTSSVPSDARPLDRWEFPHADVAINDGAPTILTIECRNVPVPTDPDPWSVAVRIVPKSGHALELTATYVEGTEELSTWTCEFTPPPGHSAIQARAYRP
jgi:hypothetical protein